jgi:hypothetical protein
MTSRPHPRAGAGDDLDPAREILHMPLLPRVSSSTSNGKPRSTGTSSGRPQFGGTMATSKIFQHTIFSQLGGETLRHAYGRVEIFCKGH